MLNPQSYSFWISDEHAKKFEEGLALSFRICRDICEEHLLWKLSDYICIEGKNGHKPRYAVC